jgi:hypothetical protein
MRRTITDIGKAVAKANVLGTNGSIDMLRVALTVGRHIKATAPATPTLEKGGILAKSRFILKDNYSSCLMTLFLTRDMFSSPIFAVILASLKLIASLDAGPKIPSDGESFAHDRDDNGFQIPPQ